MSRSKKVFLMGASGMGMAPLAMYLSARDLRKLSMIFREPLAPIWKILSHDS